MTRATKSKLEVAFAKFWRARGLSTDRDAKFRAATVRLQLSKFEGRDIYAMRDVDEIKQVCAKYDNRGFEGYATLKNAYVNACVGAARYYPDFFAQNAGAKTNKILEEVASTETAQNKTGDIVITCYGLWWERSRAQLDKNRMLCMSDEQPFNMFRQKGIYVLYGNRD